MNNENNNPGNAPNNSKMPKIIIGILAIGLMIVIILMLCTRCNPNEQIQPPDKPTETYSIGDTNEIQETDDTAAIQEKLNNQVEDGMITISMNLNPIFANGSSEGNLLITNDENNKYPQVVKIYNKEELIYTSEGVDIGHEIQLAKLDKKLEKGTYDCIAYFIAFNPETGAEVGMAGANIVITIQE